MYQNKETSTNYLLSKKCVVKGIIKTVLVNSAMSKDNTKNSGELCANFVSLCNTYIIADFV